MAAESAPRAVVVDDSTFMRTVIADILEEGGVDVIDEAWDGEEAVDRVVDRRPDVVTMDLEMPGMDGLEAVEQIMSESPTPILMLSAHTDEGASVTFDALERGAVDFFTKPGGEVTVEMARFKEQLVRKVKSVAASNVNATRRRSNDRPVQRHATSGRYAHDCTVVLGASTGGPSAVERVMASLPVEANLRILLVQHMPPAFTARFADRLDERSEYRVREAADGDRVRGGDALLAPGDHHMAVRTDEHGSLRVTLTRDPPLHGVRPAVDVTMESAADVVVDPLVGVVLTGMGHDGASGVTAISDAGGDVVVQDEDTSAVFGMPKRAIETGTVDAVAPIDSVGGAILEAVRDGESR